MRFLSASTRSRRATDRECFVLAPHLGVVALAESHAFASTALSAAGGRLASDAIDYVHLGLTDDISNNPGLAKFDPSARGPYSVDRMRASILLAHERMNAEHGALLEKIATSVIAIVANERAVSLVAAGPDAEAWRVRRGAAEVLQAPEPWTEVPLDETPWIGRGRALEIRVSRLEIEPGDVIGLGRRDPRVVDVIARAGDRFDDVLARLLAMPGVSSLRFVGACVE
jgi:hypothetical protein